MKRGRKTHAQRTRDVVLTTGLGERRCDVEDEMSAVHLQPDGSNARPHSEASTCARRCAMASSGSAFERQPASLKRAPEGLAWPVDGHPADPPHRPSSCKCQRKHLHRRGIARIERSFQPSCSTRTLTGTFIFRGAIATRGARMATERDASDGQRHRGKN